MPYFVWLLIYEITKYAGPAMHPEFSFLTFLLDAIFCKGCLILYDFRFLKPKNFQSFLLFFRFWHENFVGIFRIYSVSYKMVYICKEFRKVRFSGVNFNLIGFESVCWMIMLDNQSSGFENCSSDRINKHKSFVSVNLRGENEQSLLGTNQISQPFA